MIDLSNYSCDKCKRVGSWHCEHCWHTADKPPTRFKCKKKTGIQTPELRKPTTPPPPPTSGSNAQKTPTYNQPPMPPVKPPKSKENKTMYGLNLYIPFEELDAYIHEHIDEKYRDHTFMPIKVEVNELNCDIEIKLLSVSPIETDNCRYKLDLNALPNDSKPQRGLRAEGNVYDDNCPMPKGVIRKIIQEVVDFEKSINQLKEVTKE